MGKNIVVLGDSIIYGAFDPEFGGWVNRLRFYVEEKNYENSVYNLGICADISRELVKRFEKEAKSRDPSVIIIGIGVNDSSGNSGVNLENFKKNITNLIEKAKKLVDSSNIFFIGLNNINEDETIEEEFMEEGYYHLKDVCNYNDILEKECSSNKIGFIPMLELLDVEELCDGLHPNSRGHEKIFQKVREVLEDKKII